MAEPRDTSYIRDTRSTNKQHKLGAEIGDRGHSMQAFVTRVT